MAHGTALGPRSHLEGQRAHVSTSRRARSGHRRSDPVARRRSGPVARALSNDVKSRPRCARRLPGITLMMKLLNRSTVLGAIIVSACYIAVVRARPLAGDTRPATVSKQAMLQSIAARVYLPAYTNLAARSAELAAAADTLAASPSATTMARTRQAWTRVLLAWRRTQSFAHGPIESLGFYPRIQFWPARRQAVERVL